eukprot:m.129631 g.129631  ORF g.129631 m.129631 type:complete len:387 (-) comp16410_c0_seq6:1216-2376(-)
MQNTESQYQRNCLVNQLLDFRFRCFRLMLFQLQLNSSLLWLLRKAVVDKAVLARQVLHEACLHDRLLGLALAVRRQRHGSCVCACVCGEVAAAGVGTRAVAGATSVSLGGVTVVIGGGGRRTLVLGGLLLRDCHLAHWAGARGSSWARFLAERPALRLLPRLLLGNRKPHPLGSPGIRVHRRQRLPRASGLLLLSRSPCSLDTEDRLRARGRGQAAAVPRAHVLCVLLHNRAWDAAVGSGNVSLDRHAWRGDTPAFGHDAGGRLLQRENPVCRRLDVVVLCAELQRVLGRVDGEAALGLGRLDLGAGDGDGGAEVLPVVLLQPRLQRVHILLQHKVADARRRPEKGHAPAHLQQVAFLQHYPVPGFGRRLHPEVAAKTLCDDLRHP